jgi:hypothetical protein
MSAERPAWEYADGPEVGRDIPITSSHGRKRRPVSRSRHRARQPAILPAVTLPLLSGWVLIQAVWMRRRDRRDAAPEDA